MKVNDLMISTLQELSSAHTDRLGSSSLPYWPYKRTSSCSGCLMPAPHGSSTLQPGLVHHLWPDFPFPGASPQVRVQSVPSYLSAHPCQRSRGCQQPPCQGSAPWQRADSSFTETLLTSTGCQWPNVHLSDSAGQERSAHEGASQRRPWAAAGNKPPEVSAGTEPCQLPVATPTDL